MSDSQHLFTLDEYFYDILIRCFLATWLKKSSIYRVCLSISLCLSSFNRQINWASQIYCPRLILAQTSFKMSESKRSVRALAGWFIKVRWPGVIGTFRSIIDSRGLLNLSLSLSIFDFDFTHIHIDSKVLNLWENATQHWKWVFHSNSQLDQPRHIQEGYLSNC